MYSYPIGERNLLCGNPYEGRIMCQRGNFPHVNTMEQDGPIDAQPADLAMMSFSLPIYLEMQYLPGGNMEGDGERAPGTYRQGDLLIQYTGDTLTFTEGSVAYELGDCIAHINDNSPLLLDSSKPSEYLRSIGG